MTCCFMRSTPPQPVTGNLRWGVGVQPRTSEIYADVTALGVQMMRRVLRWNESEPNAPVSGVHTYVWTKHDATVNAVAAAGVKFLVILASGPQWACPGAPNAGPTNVADFLAWVTAITTRYAGKVECYEIWNEPQGNGLSTTLYRQMLIGAYSIIKSVDPAAAVVGMVANGTFLDGNSPTKNAWYNTVLSDPQVLASMDMASIHTYCRPFAPEIGDTRGPLDTRLANSAALLASKGFTKPVYVTEGNWPSSGTTSGVVSEADQARFLVRMSIINAVYCERFYVFHLYGAVTSDESGPMGLIRPDGTFKPAYTAEQVMTRILGPTVVSITPISTSNDRRYRFDRSDGSYGFVAWNVSGSGTQQITGLPAQMFLTTLQGSKSTINTTNGTATINTDVDPVYLETT